MSIAVACPYCDERVEASPGRVSCRRCQRGFDVWPEAPAIEVAYRTAAPGQVAVPDPPLPEGVDDLSDGREVRCVRVHARATTRQEAWNLGVAVIWFVIAALDIAAVLLLHAGVISLVTGVFLIVFGVQRVVRARAAPLRSERITLAAGGLRRELDRPGGRISDDLPLDAIAGFAVEDVAGSLRQAVVARTVPGGPGALMLAEGLGRDRATLDWLADHLTRGLALLRATGGGRDRTSD